MTTTTGPFAHTDGTDTEIWARQSVLKAVPTVQQKVLRLIVAAGSNGLTDDEGAAALAQVHQQVDRLTFGRRRNELKIAGLVQDSGQRRPSPRGRRAIVWTAVAA